MPDREKVIRALELCRYDPDPGQEKKWDHSCLKCPYCTDFTGMGMDCARMYTDAIALLREQEPRVMTLDELTEICVEFKGNACPVRLTNFDLQKIIMNVDDGICRLWTARPTDEQRKAVDWDA